MNNTKISIIVGTRPEAIKLVPIIRILKEENANIEICSTGQHKEMLKQVFDVFDIRPDIELKLMEPNQSLAKLTSKAIYELDGYFKKSKPSLIIIQGDTTTVFAAAVAAFYNKIKIAHVEAGLRTFKKYSPYPEEMNRVLTSRMTDIHFAPTVQAMKNLINEGVEKEKIFVTGNTVIDTLFLALKVIEEKKLVLNDLPVKQIKNNNYVLITGHRRENFGKGIINICEAIKELALTYPEVDFIYPVHLNPNINDVVFKILSESKNIYLIKPLSYFSFVKTMSNAKVIITDSGGVQEEAPSFGIPVLVTREDTERPEAIKANVVKLVGSNSHNIVHEFNKIMSNYSRHNLKNPYGDGKASIRIISILKKECFS